MTSGQWSVKAVGRMEEGKGGRLEDWKREERKVGRRENRIGKKQ